MPFQSMWKKAMLEYDDTLQKWVPVRMYNQEFQKKGAFQYGKEKKPHDPQQLADPAFVGVYTVQFFFMYPLYKP